MTTSTDASGTISARGSLQRASSVLDFARAQLARVLAVKGSRAAAWEEREQRRRAMAELAGLSDDLIRDMGATRGDLELELKRPTSGRDLLHRRSGYAELPRDFSSNKEILP